MKWLVSAATGWLMLASAIAQATSSRDEQCSTLFREGQSSGWTDRRHDKPPIDGAAVPADGCERGWRAGYVKGFWWAESADRVGRG